MSWQQSPGALDAVNRRIVAEPHEQVKTLSHGFSQTNTDQVWAICDSWGPLSFFDGQQSGLRAE